jgi:hypothetical protein
MKIEMVKDNWTTSPPNGNNVSKDVETPAPVDVVPISIDTNQQVQKQNNDNNIWGYYESKENFINLHLC